MQEIFKKQTLIVELNYRQCGLYAKLGLYHNSKLFSGAPDIN